jgi:hypothetical protein
MREAERLWKSLKFRMRKTQTPREYRQTEITKLAKALQAARDEASKVSTQCRNKAEEDEIVAQQNYHQGYSHGYASALRDEGARQSQDAPPKRMGDGGLDLKETQYKGDDDRYHYRVHLTRKVYQEESVAPGNTFDHSWDHIIPAEGRDIDIPDAKVLDPKSMHPNCTSADQTCIRPELNVLWLNPVNGDVYCYLPMNLGF